MSHTYRAEGPHDATGVTVFNFNSDLSGVVSIHRDGTTFLVPAHHLLEFVADFIRNEKIARLERLDTMQILMGEAKET